MSKTVYIDPVGMSLEAFAKLLDTLTGTYPGARMSNHGEGFLILLEPEGGEQS